MLQSERARQTLMQTNPEFRRLAEEHSRYSEQLAALACKSPRTIDDQAEETRLKKLKLRAKDRMEELIRDYRREQAEAVEAT